MLILLAPKKKFRTWNVFHLFAKFIEKIFAKLADSQKKLFLDRIFSYSE